jgi:flagellar assembly protein FliH
VAAKAKYLFDLDFTAGANPAERPIPPAEHAIKLAEAESRAFGEGFAAAEKEAIAVAERRTAAAFEQIGDALGRLAQGLSAVETRLEAEAIELALAIARKLAPELVARQPLAEIAALAGECFRQLASAPHVVVRVSDALLESARTQLEEIARAHGFEGRLVVVGEPQIAAGDCKIEWADGGVVRNQAKTDEAISNTVWRYLGARRSAVLPEMSPETSGNE